MNRKCYGCLYMMGEKACNCDTINDDRDTKPATLEGYLRRTYGNDIEALEDMAEDGCDWGGDMTRGLYNQYYDCIWLADTAGHNRKISSFANHTGFARYMLSHAVRYYCTIIIASRED